MGRGRSGIGSSHYGNGSAADMNVDWDKWGEVLNPGVQITEMGEDGIPVVVGRIYDETVFIYEPDEHPITKKDILDEIAAWKNDDGTYGIEDTSIFVAYDDGTFFSSDGSKMSGYRDKFKKSGIIGATVMTGDYEMVWGGERNRKTGQIEPYKTWVSPEDEDNGKEGKSNSYSGYKAVSQYMRRIKKTYNNKLPNGRSVTKNEVIRKSKVRKVDW